MKKAIFTKQELYELTREAFYSRDMERQSELPTAWREFSGEQVCDPKFLELEDVGEFELQLDIAARGVEKEFHELQDLHEKKSDTKKQIEAKKQEITEKIMEWLSDYCIK